MTPAKFRIEIPGALPPRAILPALGQEVRPRVLEACADEGWSTGPIRGGAGLQLLAIDPVAEFLGGPEALDDARRWLDPCRGAARGDALVIGALSYEFGFAFHPRASPGADIPDDAVDLAGFRAAYSYEPGTGTGEVAGGDLRAVERCAARIEAACNATSPETPAQLGAVSSPSSDAAFLDSVRAILEWIRAGDAYQVNLSRRLDSSAPSRPELRALYRRLAERALAPFGAYLETPRRTVLSASPERFLRVEGDRIETCPIKGTRPRGPHTEEDRLLAKELLASTKDRAEHVMIVDLARNDLGRICRIGSVSVPRLAALRSYASVHHLVSSVGGTLRDPLDWQALFEATFPGGSITGAPKLRAMQIIDALEPVPRDVYTGAVGYFDAAGGMDLSIAIRTAIARDGQLHLSLGGGIVADSDPEAELAETRDKGRDFARVWGLSG